MLRYNFTGHRKDTEMLENYFEIFKLIKWPRAILEIGIDQGGSLKLLNDLFNPDLLVGLDNGTIDFDWKLAPVRTFYYDQKDKGFDKLNGQKFDMIIDDASHVTELTINSFNLFWPLLTKGGVYIVEDWPHYEMEGFFEESNNLAKREKATLFKKSNLIAFIK